MSIEVNVSLAIHTCTCGSLYALPHWMSGHGRCPMCAHRKFEAQGKEIEHLEKIVRYMRGTITRLKNKKGKR
jgi:hypothetical protein